MGAPNKNIGDAFLFVWKIPKEHYYESKKGKLKYKKSRIVSNFADFSLISIVKILCKMNTSIELDSYRNNPELLKRIPDFRVRMGFGLHFGWAIEGSIGSDFKIDASYLAPNVNLASRLESATK